MTVICSFADARKRNAFVSTAGSAVVTTSEPAEQVARLRVENVGGIDDCDVDIQPGVTVLAGRNATNRTSLLQALMAVLGSDDVSMKRDADEASVRLDLGGTTYTRVLRRERGTVVSDGDPLLADPTVADLFAFLLESNEARRAVATGGDLRDLIMRPVDTDAIQAEIEQTLRERETVDDELGALDSLKSDLTGLERRRRELEDAIEDKRATLADTQAEIDSLDADVDETRERRAELEDRLAELNDRRTELERVRSDVEVQQESIESLRAERRELNAELADLSDDADEQRPDDGEIERLRERKDRLETEVSELQDIISFNEQRLDETAATADHALTADEPERESPTDRLLDDDTVSCWTCGSTVARERIDDTVDELKSVRASKLGTISDIESDLDELKRERRERSKRRQRRETVERKLEEVADEIDRREETLAAKRAERERLTESIDSLETEIDELELDHVDDILALHRDANQLEFDLEQLESEYDDVTDRIGEIEDRLATEDDLRARRAEIQDRLEDLRTRIAQLEREAVDAFNTHMDEVLQILEYENLNRIWIERKASAGADSRVGERAEFELHVVRSTATGATYEDTIDHLSESEREVTGIVFALAGYLVHDVYETVPFMLLDSMEAIDSERLADLVEYVASYPEFLVVALLPGDAESVAERHHRVDYM